MVWHLAKRHPEHPWLSDLLVDLKKTFGLKSKLTAPVVGRYLTRTRRKEDKRLADGWQNEPSIVRRVNDAASVTDRGSSAIETEKLIWVEPRPLDEVL